MAPSRLPAEFAKIPPDSPKSGVLASIPNTPESREALIANDIPQNATVKRNEAKLSVQYDGAPQFVSIGGTTLQYAHNTAVPVIKVDASSFYAVDKGIWFTASAATGPVDGGDQRAGRDLLDPDQLAAALRHLRARVRQQRRRGLCRLHAGLLRHGGHRQRRRLRHRLRLRPVGRRVLVRLPGHLRHGRVLRLERLGRLDLRLRLGLVRRLVRSVQPVVGSVVRPWLRLGLLGRRRRGVERLRPLGQRRRARHGRGLGRSVDRQRRSRRARRLLQRGHRRSRRRPRRRQHQHLHRHHHAPARRASATTRRPVASSPATAARRSIRTPARPRPAAVAPWSTPTPGA